MGASRNLRKLQERPDDLSAMAIVAFVVACAVTLFGCCLYAFVVKNAEGLRMMWKYRDLDGVSVHCDGGARWSWWLYKTPKQRADLARLIEENRQKNGYYEKRAENGKLPWFWEYVCQFSLWAVLAYWLYWAISDWLWSPASAEAVAGADNFFCVSGMCLVISLACKGVEYLTVCVLDLVEGPQVNFFMAWLFAAAGHLKNAMPIIAFANGFCIVWNSYFPDEEVLSGPEVVLMIVVFLAAFIMMHYPDGLSEAEQQSIARARSRSLFCWYDDVGDKEIKAAYWEAYEETASELEEKAVTQPFKLTKAQRKALGKEREAQQEAERQARVRAERKARKSELMIAREASATDASERKRRLAQLQAKREEHVKALQRKVKRLEELDEEAAALRQRRDEAEFRYQKWLARTPQSLLDGGAEDAWSETTSESSKCDAADAGPSHSDHVDSADLAAQTLRNKEEAERQRRVREQREKEKAAQKEKEYSEAGPSHREGAPKWEAPAPDEGDKAKREAEKQASLLRKQEQQKERVREKEARERREKERLQSLKTGKRILQGNVHSRAGSCVQRSSLQPLREDEPGPTLTLADVALGFYEDPRFQMQEDDLESVATTAVDPMLTHHADERKGEREYTEHEIKHTKKYGRVESGNKPGTYVHHPCREGDPKLVTNSEGTVLTVI